MKKTVLILISCFALALGASAAEQKIATIDLRKVFDNYWRTKQADSNLKEQAADLEKESKAMVEQLRKNEERYRKLVEGANDQSISPTERDKRKKDAENELLGLREMEAKINQIVGVVTNGLFAARPANVLLLATADGVKTYK